jgi:intracellular sulfur oxidation DsrE/DsrF family protein
MSMSFVTERRTAVKTLAATVVAGIGSIGLSGTQAGAMGESSASLVPGGATSLKDLVDRLARAPRRRDFKTVPPILNHPDLWDDEALREVISYRPDTKQAWDNTDIAGPWLNVMRNSLNAQIWAFKHPDFLVVSATHGTAQLALYDQAMWDKYGLFKLAGKGFDKNTLILEHKVSSDDIEKYEDPAGAFSGKNNTIPALQSRGAVFLACHNAIWEQASKLIEAGSNPDKLTVSTLAAELTNHLIPGVVLTPGAVATLPELQRAGFAYAR